MVPPKKNKSTNIVNDDNFEEFSSLEESIVRIRDGVQVDDNAVLKRKSDDHVIKNRLLELEQEIIKRARNKGII